MKKAQSVGLIAAGNLTDAPLTRFWWLSERLGPVKSASYRVASRIANMLQAGRPVKDYAEFESCVLILVCVPEGAVSRVVSELASSGIAWAGKAVVLCSTWLDSGELRELAACGASVGSISPIPGFDDERYVVEGDAFAIRQARSLVEVGQRRAVAIERPLKPFYLAALTCTGTLLLPLILAASESLHHAHIPPALSATLLERQIIRTFRSFLKGGRRAYPSARELPRQLRALADVNPELAYYLEQSASLASRLISKR
jgi:predicted short-subunit dehydrogenase-like oxidoreductase (DUF2520 family)